MDKMMRMAGRNPEGKATAIKTDESGNVIVQLNANISTKTTPSTFEIPANGRVMVGNVVLPDGNYTQPLDISKGFKALIVINSSSATIDKVNVDIFQSVKGQIANGNTRVFNKPNYQEFVQEGVYTRYFEIPLLGEDLVVRLVNTTGTAITMNKVIFKLF